MLELSSYAGIQTEVVDVEHKTTSNSRIDLRLQLHTGMKQRGCTLTDALTYFGSDWHSRGKTSDTDMPILAVKVEERQCNVLQETLPAIVQQ